MGVKAAAPVVGGIGKFAAKQAFGAAVSGLKNPLDPKGDAEAKAKNAEPARDGEKKKKKKKKIVKLTGAAEAEARRKAGKTVRKVEKKRGGSSDCEARRRGPFFFRALRRVATARELATTVEPIIASRAKRSPTQCRV